MDLETRAQTLMNEIDRILRRNQHWDFSDTDDRIEMHKAILPVLRDAFLSRSDGH